MSKDENGKLSPEEVEARNRAQIAEALGPDNCWYAGVRFGHSPTIEEALKHFVENGGAEDFARRWGEESLRRS